MFFHLLAFSSHLYLFFIGPASAQVSGFDCPFHLPWEHNSIQQSPCLIAAYLGAVCNNGVFAILPLKGPNDSYTGPSGTDDGDLCKCNTVTYNLICACSECQGGLWISYPTWSANCTTKGAPGTFPEPVPAGTRIPLWAYIDTSNSSWDILAAEATGGLPEVTGTASFAPTSVASVSQSTLTPGSSAAATSETLSSTLTPGPSATITSAALSSTSSSIPHNSSKTGPIVGGVTGGIIAIIGALAWFVIRRRHRRRRRRARSAPSMADSDMSGQGDDMGYPLTIDTRRLYDPSSSLPTITTN